MTPQSKATKAAAPAAAPAPAVEAESLDDRIARLNRENEAMRLELENKLLRARLGLPENKTF